jgi:hypothetical protein
MDVKIDISVSWSMQGSRMPDWVRCWEQRTNERDRAARATELLLRELAAADMKRGGDVVGRS